MGWFESLAAGLRRKRAGSRDSYIGLLRAAIAGKLSEAKQRELEAAAEVLGYGPDTILEHARALEEHDQATREAAGLAAVNQQIERIHAGLAELDRQHADAARRLQEQAAVIQKSLPGLESERSRLTSLADRADALRGEYPALFASATADDAGGPTTAPPLSTRAEATRDLASREIVLRAATADEASRSVEVVLSTETPTRVMDWARGVIEEVLVVGGGEFPAQLPLLDNHQRELDAVLGKVTDIKQQGGSWIGRAYFADDERGLAIWNKVKGGYLTDVSIGYVARAYEDIPAGNNRTINGRTFTAGDLPLRITNAWQAKEVSVVPIGADPLAKTRGMDGAQDDGPAKFPPARGGYATPVLKLDGQGRMDPTTRGLLVVSGLRADADAHEAEEFLRGMSAQGLRSSQAAIAAGMILRAGLPVENERLATAGHTWARASLPEICQEVAKLEGHGHMKPHEAYRAAVGTQTLTALLTTVVNAALLAAWEDEIDTTAGWCAERDVKDFKTIEAVGVELDAQPQRMVRGGTARDVGGEAPVERYALGRYTRQFFFDEMDVVDDRFDALLDVPDAMGRGARRVRPDLVMSILLANAALDADSVALFHADHNNLASGVGSVLQTSSVTAAISAVLKQLVNKRVSNIRGQYLLVPGELAGTARVIARTMELTAARDNLIVHADARLGPDGVVDPASGTQYAGTATNWFLAAAAGKTIEVAYKLGSNRLPVLRSWPESGGRWGTCFDVCMDVGAAPLDYKGLYKSVGA